MKLKIFLFLTSTILLSCFVCVGLTIAAVEGNPDEVIALSSAIRSALPEVFGETGFAAVGGFGVPIVGGPTIPGAVSELSGDIDLPPYGGTPPPVVPPPPPGNPHVAVPRSEEH